MIRSKKPVKEQKKQEKQVDHEQLAFLKYLGQLDEEEETK